MENSKKRKRDGDYPRITYHALSRTFDRLFRDDDFDAFCSLAHSAQSVDVRITVGEEQDEVLPSTPATPIKKRKRHRNKSVAVEASDPPLPTNEDTARANAASNVSVVVPSEIRKKKKRKISSDVVLEEHATGAPSGSLPEPVESIIVPDDASGPATLESTEGAAPVGHGKAKKKRKGKEDVEQFPVGGEVPPTKRKKSKNGNKQMEERQPIEIIAPTSENQEPAQKDVSSEKSQVPITQQHLHTLNLTLEKRKKPKKQSSEVQSEPTGSLSEPVITKAQLDTEKVNASGAEVDSTNVKEAISVTSKKIKELSPAAKAEMDAVFEKVLAAKRAARAVNIDVTPQNQEPVVSKSKKKKKKTEKVSETVQSDLQRPEPSISAMLSNSEKPHPTSKAEPTCPLCRLSPPHDNSKCPLVLGGPESLRSRLQELEEASEDGRVNQLVVIRELRELLRIAEQNRAKDTATRLDSPNSQQSQSSNRGQRLSPNLINGTPSQSISTRKNHAFSVTNPTAHTPAKNADVTSSSDTSDDDNSVHDTVFPVVSQNPEYLSNLSLEDIVRGSGISALQIAKLESSPETSDEEDNADDEENMTFDEEPKAPRHSRKFGIQDSSDDDDSDFGDAQIAEEEPEEFATPSASPLPELSPDSGADPASFRAIDRIGESQEVDRSADAAFGAALELDTAILNPPDASQATTSSEPTPGVDPSVAPSPKPTDLVNHVDITPPISPSVQVLSMEPSASQPVTSTPLTCLRTSPSECEPRDDAKPAGIIQRMKPRSSTGKAHVNDMDIDLPLMVPTSDTQLSQDSQDVLGVATRRTRASTRRQTLGSMTPPALPARLGRQTRLIRPSLVLDQTTEGSNDLLVPSTPQDDSLDTWVAMNPSSPAPDGDVTIQVDELEPISPQPTPAKNDNDNDNEDDLENGEASDPLFIISESLPTFPYSQWNDATPREDDGDDTKEAETTVKKPQRKARQSQNSRYRRLTDISSDHGFFSTPTNLRTTRSSTAAKKATDMYGRTRKDDIESESETESDNSEAEEQSHIPKSRRAGARQAKRK
ncbi:hypothetical protein H0H92_009940 [Tricholoma furcatifolium]|nr:hypothetical protein H0H92_009940 [Tricholoma furcatifolium]